MNDAAVMDAPTQDLGVLKKRHDRDMEANNGVGVTEYESGEKQSDAVFEVTHGYKHLPGGAVLGPGNLFHPTVRQVETDALRGKAKEITRAQARELASSGSPRAVVGADIGLAQLKMAPVTRKFAADARLVPEDFAGIVGEGANGAITKEQVEAVIAAKNDQ